MIVPPPFKSPAVPSLISSMAILRLKSMGNVTKTFEQGLAEIT